MHGLSLSLIVYMLAHVIFIVRVLVVEGKEPTSRTAWVLIMLFLPYLGILAYVLFGEPWVPHRLRHKAAHVGRELHGYWESAAPDAMDHIPERFHAGFRIGEKLAMGGITHGNGATLPADSNAVIDAMVADFDAATDSIEVMFYIWLPDNNGCRVVEALEKAAGRGVTCRVIADGVGSRTLIASRHWAAMRVAGVRLHTSMKVSFGLSTVLGSRVDLRNHRKIVVVDNRVAYCGSQNCADPEFRIKPKYAPWVDIMLRVEGPVAWQTRLLFASSWMMLADEDLTVESAPPAVAGSPQGFDAVAFGTGPMSPRGAMSDVFVALLYSARDNVVISSPYFVPDPALLAALAGCARRGVSVSLILPARNDSKVVAAISHAHYRQLVVAGVSIHEYRGGLLHAKTLVVDGVTALVGSANMDRRSLELNFENNMLLYSPATVGLIRERQDDWLSRSVPVSRDKVMNRSVLRRIGDNIATIFSPVM